MISTVQNIENSIALKKKILRIIYFTFWDYFKNNDKTKNSN